ncbi:MAG: hypothetical protein E7436_01525 [Ruminococcaceae bacterium]|nr:hypothetical protein [Oscillospiraceae bacterium]
MNMTVTMGRLPAGSGEDQALEWLVLERRADRMLLVSKHCLAERPFHGAGAVTWAECDLRRWLRDMEEEWFTEEERARILTARLETSVQCCFDDDEVPTDEGMATEDRFFLLSAHEALRYFSDDNARQCDGGWWLRSRGYSPGYAADVLPNGEVCGTGEEVYEDGGVRPAMWVRNS